MPGDYFLPSYLRDSPLYKNNKRLYSRVPLPTHWNVVDSSPSITIVDDEKLTVKYNGLGRNWVDAASIRANHPIHPEIGLYYYEMTIIDRGDRGCIGIGLSKPATRLNRMPGWEPDTIGYHGDDGNLYCERGSGVKFGPLYTTGETVGCGINFFDKYVFFTKNGVILGIELQLSFEGYPFGAPTKDKIMGEMYPMCGMESPNESLTVNFGEKPFKFNIDCYAKGINTSNPIASPSGDEIIAHNTNSDVAPVPETTPAISAIAETQMNANDTNITDAMTSASSGLGDI
ncbi:3503_t:CDS:2, partial [Cetraspora pellucida]